MEFNNSREIFFNKFHLSEYSSILVLNSVFLYFDNKMNHHTRSSEIIIPEILKNIDHFTSTPFQKAIIPLIFMAASFGST